MIHTDFCDLLGIDHPIVQAGMAARHTNPDLVAAVSGAGALGVLGCHFRTAEDATASIARIRALTDRPFGVNFVLHRLDTEYDTFEATLAARVPVFSFFRGDPAEAVARAHDAGALTIYQVTTLEEAARALETGVDVIVAQGTEAGGHSGPNPLMGFLSDVLTLVDGRRPVLAAGGIVDGRALAAVLCLGASGVLMGTRFLVTPEAPDAPFEKQALIDSRPGDTIASPIPDILWEDPWPGVQVRTIRNPLISRWLGREDDLRASLPEVQDKAEEAYNAENAAEFWILGGMGAGRITEIKPAARVVHDIVAEAEQTLLTLAARIQPATATPPSGSNAQPWPR